MAFKIERYTHTRHWALYDGDELVCVTVYKRGARAVQQRLAAQRPSPRAGAAQAAAKAAAQQALALAVQARTLGRQAAGAPRGHAAGSAMLRDPRERLRCRRGGGLVLPLPWPWYSLW